MERDYFQKVVSLIILGILFVLAFFLLKPIFLSVIFGIILAFLFSPLYDRIHKKVKSRDFSATIITVGVIVLLIVLLWYTTPVILDQSIEFYQASRQVDFVKPLEKIFPDTEGSSQFAQQVGSALHSSVTSAANSLMNSFSNSIMNVASAILKLVVVFFTFYFILRDKEKLIDYLRSLSPFSKPMEKNLFKSSKQITLSVLYGQVVLGIVEGLVASIGYFIFGVNNAVLLTIISVFAGILPIIGTAIVWGPVAIFLIIEGSVWAAFGIVVFGILSWLINNLVKPVFISRRTKLNSAVILISMVGGLLVFGLLGLILGPLIISYLIIMLETYRKKREAPSILIEEENGNKAENKEETKK